MNPENNHTHQSLERSLNEFVAAETDFPFGPEVLVYKVKGKMFALLSEREGRKYINLKCQPEDGEVLTAQFDAITPGYHMNKRHWVTVYLDGDVEKGMLDDLCEQSYRLVVKTLRKADRETLSL
ncbi:MmcQ/YjbR family DNA-binding protein [Vibrio paucivorans]|uniref:MmcQ/YjbR family DNA-binding protein n=1 Tax=Vibrio paucivorans TaxID=2829489 RepID=A0A9X3HR25_9VIBR|nr:MmcQ/YjbR family DNA-binding protein [Vibrio paucivorans]MCW8333658.1 MmcQ/YjbR family DNA-binding protein [Vibrio paucivorans]